MEAYIHLLLRAIEALVTAQTLQVESMPALEEEDAASRRIFAALRGHLVRRVMRLHLPLERSGEFVIIQ